MQGIRPEQLGAPAEREFTLDIFRNEDDEVKNNSLTIYLVANVDAKKQIHLPRYEFGMHTAPQLSCGNCSARP